MKCFLAKIIVLKKLTRVLTASPMCALYTCGSDDKWRKIDSNTPPHCKYLQVVASSLTLAWLLEWCENISEKLSCTSACLIGQVTVASENCNKKHNGKNLMRLLRENLSRCP